MRTIDSHMVNRFAKHEDGTIAILFGITFSVATLITGLAIDVGRLVHSENKVSAAIDTAALAAAKAMRDTGASDDRIREVADQYFRENMTGAASDYSKINSVNVEIDHTKNAITVGVNIDVKTLFGSVAGFDKFTFLKSATALYDPKDIEIGMQLDVTGSMNDHNKLQHLKDAVAGTGGLLDIMMPTSGTSNRVRIGLAPYASGVNAGTYAMAVSRNRAADGCVYERLNLDDQDTDAPAIGAQSLRSRSDLTGEQACSAGAKVVALTNNREGLRREIYRWTAGSSTAGHLGTAWAWYLISPEWSAVWPNSSLPVQYNDGKTMKVAILMTDGIYNTVAGTSNGDYGTKADQSKQLAKATCDAMKAKGIVIYTVGFEVPADAKPTLTYCASGSSKFFDATDGAKLKAAFRAIAVEINNLRLSS